MSDYEKFLEQKEQIATVLETAIASALSEMGGDIQGVSWFSVKADEYNAQQYDIAV